MTTAALVVLTLGIGATTAVFSIVDAVVLHPLPYPDPDRLVAVRESVDPRRPALTSVYLHYFADWSAEQHVFREIAAISFAGPGFVDQGAQSRSLYTFPAFRLIFLIDRRR